MADHRKPATAEQPLPGRDEIRTAMLYLARLLLSYDGGPYSGPLRISITQTEEKESRSFKPKGAFDGMTAPDWFALGDRCPTTVSASELLRVLLSPDEEKLLLDLLAHQPCSASSVQGRCRSVLGKSDFWAAWGQLQKRQLVEQGDDDRYRVGPEWLANWLRSKAPVKAHEVTR